jgi:hypothetical protein
MGKSALIPMSTLGQAIELLGMLDTTNHGGYIRNMHVLVLQELKTKVQKSELRDEYAKVICANGDGARADAFNKYLDHKNKIGAADVCLSDEERFFQAYYSKVCRR